MTAILRASWVAALALVLLPALPLRSGEGPFPDPGGPDAVITSREVEITIALDGRMTRRVRVETKLNSLLARSRLADPRIRYNQDFQELVVFTSTTTTLDGRVIDSPPYALNSAVADDVAASPAFSAERELVVTFTGVEAGATIVLDYELTDREPWRPSIDGRFYFSDHYPVTRSRIRIRRPGRMPLHTLVVNPVRAVQQLEPTHEAADTVEEWVAEDLPSFTRDDGDRPRWEPHLLFSAAAGWEEVLGPAREALASAATDEKVGALHKALGSDLKDTDPQTRRLAVVVRNFASLFRPLSLEHSAAVWKVRPLGEVAASRQATPLEAGLLMVTLLRRSGMEAGLVLAGTPGAPPAGETGTAPLPGFAQFTRLLVKVQLDEEPSYVIPGSPGLLVVPPVKGDRWAAVLDSSKRLVFGRTSALLPCQGGSFSLTASLTPDATGFDVHLVVASSGAGSLWPQWAAKLAAGVPEKTLAAGLMPGLAGTSAKVTRATPGTFDADFHGRLKKGDTTWQTVGAAPGAMWLDRLLAPWAAGRSPRPMLDGPVAYEMALTCSPAPAGTAAGLAPLALESPGALYKVEVQTKGSAHTVRRLFQLTSTPSASPQELPEAVRRFLNDNGGAALALPLKTTAPAAGTAPASP